MALIDDLKTVLATKQQQKIARRNLLKTLVLDLAEREDDDDVIADSRVQDAVERLGVEADIEQPVLTDRPRNSMLYPDNTEE